MDRPQIDRLRQQVQHNCHVADAGHAREYGLCTYLMKMREFYRWEQGLGFRDSLDMDRVGTWLSERERLWGELADAGFAELEIDGERFDPFDIAEVNDRLLPRGLVYSGGLGGSCRPSFFLAELEQLERDHGQVRVVAGRELARDLASPAAMLRTPYIFVRRESLRRLLWEKLESWRWRRPDNALGRAFACYDFDRRLEESLERMAGQELELVLLHERGEHRAGELLGEAWNRMLQALAHTPAELMARAVRDHLADSLETLPALARCGEAASIHFYVGNLGGMRKELYPGLSRVYERWRDGGAAALFEQAADHGRDHWLGAAEAMLALFRQRGDAAAEAIRERVSDWRLE